MSNKSFGSTLLMLVVSLCTMLSISHRSVPVVVKTNLENIPMVIDGYFASEDSFPESVYRELNADKHVYRHYRSRNGKQMDLYIGYYGTAKGGRTGHNPYACLPSEGIAIVDTGNVYLWQEARGEKVPVNYILATKDGNNIIMLHWYQTAGRTVISTGARQNIARFIGKLRYNRNDGAFVRVTTQTGVSEVAESKKDIEVFAEKTLNLIPDYWPLEK